MVAAEALPVAIPLPMQDNQQINIPPQDHQEMQHPPEDHQQAHLPPENHQQTQLLPQDHQQIHHPPEGHQQTCLSPQDDQEMPHSLEDHQQAHFPTQDHQHIDLPPEDHQQIRLPLQDRQQTPECDTMPSSPMSSLTGESEEYRTAVIPLPWLSQLREISRSSTPNTYDSDTGSGLEPLSVETLSEWQWPSENGDWYMLQEHVKELLGSRNFHRKYPEIHRHQIGAEERIYLTDIGILSETSSSFSYIGILTEDVLDIMQDEYPRRYKDIMKVFRTRELERCIKQVIQDSEGADEDQDGKMSHNLRDELIEESRQYNKKLRTEHGAMGRTYYCSQTHQTMKAKNDVYHAPPSLTKVGKYPVAILPGQFTDGYPTFNSEELYTMPLNTVLFQHPVQRTIEKRVFTAPKHITVLCLSCKCEVGKSDIVMRCTTCRSYVHSSCINMSQHMMDVASTYAWECMECKKCAVCRDQDQEESMMFCDVCDRGYHMLCVDMKVLPRGRWECEMCVKCACCDTRTSSNWTFQHKPIENGSQEFIQTMCTKCSEYFEKGWFCPACLKVFDYHAVDDPMVCCDFCDRWVHTVCDGIDEDHYKEIGSERSLYKCVLCRGEKSERYDIHHKKYLQSPPPVSVTVTV